MVVRSQSEIDEILRKRDLVALREMIKNWSPSAVVRVMTELATEDQPHQGDRPPTRTSLLHGHPLSSSPLFALR